MLHGLRVVSVPSVSQATRESLLIIDCKRRVLLNAQHTACPLSRWPFRKTAADLITAKINGRTRTPSKLG